MNTCNKNWLKKSRYFFLQSRAINLINQKLFHLYLPFSNSKKIDSFYLNHTVLESVLYYTL